MSLRPFAGVYVPQCTPLGYFKVIQVHGSTGHSWCVNPETGAKVESSDVAPGASAPQCGKCFFELAKYYGAGHVIGSVGRTKPICDDNGLFTPVQHSGSSGYSWCVNPETGDKIEGTEVAPGAGTANCEAAREKRSLPGPCVPHRPVSLRPLVGVYTPQCTPMGFFRVIQSHTTGYSWCVNPETGAKVEGSDVGPGEGVPQCGKCLYELAKFYGPGFVNIVGRQKANCDANGYFTPQQRSASSGYTWCVNIETGEKIEGTETAPGEEVVNCLAREKRAIASGPCQPGRWPMSLRPFAGIYVPQCTVFGYFKVVQVHGSTGYSWCVNPETGAKIEGSDVAPGAGQANCGKCLYDLLKYYSVGMVSVGRTYPQCDANGRFKPLQQNPSSGYMWCVDPETGAKIEGSEKFLAAGEKPSC